MMSMVFAYLGYLIFSSLSPLQRRFLAQGKSSNYYLQLRFALESSAVLVLISFVLLIFHPLEFNEFPIHLIGYTVLCAITGATTILLAYNAQKHIEAGVTNVLLLSSVPVTIILGTIFLNETLGVWQVFGSLILILGIYLASCGYRMRTVSFNRYYHHDAWVWMCAWRTSFYRKITPSDCGIRFRCTTFVVVCIFGTLLPRFFLSKQDI